MPLIRPARNVFRLALYETEFTIKMKLILFVFFQVYVRSEHIYVMNMAVRREGYSEGRSDHREWLSKEAKWDEECSITSTIPQEQPKERDDDRDHHLDRQALWNQFSRISCFIHHVFLTVSFTMPYPCNIKWCYHMALTRIYQISQIFEIHLSW